MLAPILVQLDTIEKLLDQFDQTALNISAAKVGWHLEHVLLVCGRVSEALIQSNPADYQWQFNWRKTMVLLTKKIPRGRAKAPKGAHPDGTQSVDALRQRIPALKLKLESVKQLHPNAHFLHPFFGKLPVKDTLRFLFVHNQHHLKIVQDILAHNSIP